MMSKDGKCNGCLLVPDDINDVVAFVGFFHPWTEQTCQQANGCIVVERPAFGKMMNAIDAEAPALQEFFEVVGVYRVDMRGVAFGIEMAQFPFEGIA